MRYKVILSIFTFLVLFTTAATAFDITGGSAWKSRNGFGITGGLGGANCIDDFCDETIDSNLMGSFLGFVGMDYRFIPNLSLYADFTAAYVNTDVDHWNIAGIPFGDIDNDRGFLMTIIVGAAFHLPVVTWLDLYLGFGIGYSYMGFWAELERGNSEYDLYLSYKGLDFELRTGATVYLFSKAPTFGLGPFFRAGFPAWITACYDDDDGNDDCDSPDDIEDNTVSLLAEVEESPVLFEVGVEIRYGF
jgi:hypothetical protein